MQILVDSDLLLYRACAACEEEFEWDTDQWTLNCDAGKARQIYWDHVDTLVAAAKGSRDDVVHCWTDKSMFRRRLYPDYKSSRKGQRKPLAFAALKAEILALPTSYMQADLEADDVISILARKATQPYVIFSGDKDLLQIPGTHVAEMDVGGSVMTHTVSEFEAAKAMWIQAVAGDATDSVPGCRGIGQKRAERLIEEAVVQDEDTGEWLLPDWLAWPLVLQAYEKAGHGAGYAQLMVNLTRLVTPDQITPKGVMPWEPPLILSTTPTSSSTPT